MEKDMTAVIEVLNQLAEKKLNHLQDMLELTESLANALANDRDEEIEKLLNLRQEIIDQVDDLDRKMTALLVSCSSDQLAQWQERQDLWHQEQQRVLAGIITSEEKNQLAAETLLHQTKDKMKRAKLSREVFNHYGSGSENPQMIPGMISGRKLDQKK